MTDPIDIAALRARLREYDPAVPRCHAPIEERRNYAPDHTPEYDRAVWDVVTTSRCCRPAEHEGPCRNTRLVMGWPGFATVTALLDEVERLRDEKQRFREAYAALLQTSADLCVVCGWRFFVPDVGCQGCERARLEAEVNDLRMMVDGLETAAHEERAAVVAWLRTTEPPRMWAALPDAADAIERGEHRRKEDKP